MIYMLRKLRRAERNRIWGRPFWRLVPTSSIPPTRDFYRRVLLLLTYLLLKGLLR